MAEYQIYFLDSEGRIQARHEYGAEHDAEAATIAAVLGDACLDACVDPPPYR